MADAATPGDVTGTVPVLYGAATAVLLLSATAVLYEWRRSGLPFRDWWDSLR